MHFTCPSLWEEDGKNQLKMSSHVIKTKKKKLDIVSSDVVELLAVLSPAINR